MMGLPTIKYDDIISNVCTEGGLTTTLYRTSFTCNHAPSFHAIMLGVSSDIGSLSSLSNSKVVGGASRGLLWFLWFFLDSFFWILTIVSEIRVNVLASCSSFSLCSLCMVLFRSRVIVKLLSSGTQRTRTRMEPPLRAAFAI